MARRVLMLLRMLQQCYFLDMVCFSCTKGFRSPCHACIKPAAYLYVDYTLGRYCVNSVVRFTDYSLFVESLNQTDRC